MLIKGTAAFSIFVGIISFYLIWRLTKLLDMQLLSTILGQVIGVGVIALIIVFQQELRRLLLLFGTKYFSNMQVGIEQFFTKNVKTDPDIRIKAIYTACNHMSATRTGALIVIGRKSSLAMWAETGDILNAYTSSRLLETIFIKNGPLHDGAVLIENERILAARCVLPVSEDFTLPAHFGMRHRAGIGATENTDAFVIMVSEETGNISVAEHGEIIEKISGKELLKMLQLNFSSTQV
jgi:uncharacterized protein (TIGR00159 family)